jgi:uncharacterized Zn-finger protein
LLLDFKMPIDPPEVFVVNTARVSCDGGGALGHPKVFLQIGEENFVDCGYCDRRFVLSDAAIEARDKGEAPAH